jgi:hypothetical protein
MGGFFMLHLREIARRREVWALVGLTIATVIAGRWLVPTAAVPALVAKSGYWFMLAAFLLFGHALWRLARAEAGGWTWSRADGAALALILAVNAVWFAHEKPGFKILADEVLLLGTSMTMHYDREVAYPVRASDAQGPFQLVQRVLDKRPFFYPFLVSLVHDLTGYRTANAFALNAVLGVVFLGLVYRAGWRLAGSRWAGVALVLLFGGLPLLAQQAAGGGFELLNLCMIAAVLLLACRYLSRPDEVSLVALCLAGVLLALTRYESVIFVVPVALVVLAGWWRADRLILPWTATVSPVLLLPYLLQNRVFELNQSSWELASRPGSAAPFALAYVPDNIGHAAAFFFDTTGYQANSIFFAAVGLVAVPFFVLMIVRALRAPRTAAPELCAAALIGLGLLAVTGLLLAYFWGQFDHPVIRRLSLPVHLLLAVSIVVVGARLFRNPRAWQVLSGAALAAMLFQGMPMMAKQAYAWDYTPGIEMAWRAEFIAHHPAKDYLFIDRDSIFWITQRIPATPIEQARLRKEGLAYHLRNHSFSAMYVFQRYTSDDATGQLKLDPADDIGPDFELEGVWQKRVATLHFARISRIKAIREGGRVVAEASAALPSAAAPRTPEELSKAKAEFLEHWIKQLP